MEDKEKAKRAKKTSYSVDLCDEICAKISEGGNIKEILSSSDDYPVFQTWCDWKRKHPELATKYHNAIQDKSESCIANIYQTIKDLKKGSIDHRDARLLIDTDKWLASKYYPKMFGTNSSVDLTTDGEKISQVNVFQIPENNRGNELDHEEK